VFKTILTLERFDEDMRLLEKRERESRSWLKHFFDEFYPMTSFTQLVTINDIGGVARTLAACGIMNNAGPYCNLQVVSSPGNTGLFVPISQVGGYDWNGATPYRGEDVGIVVGTNNGGASPLQDALLSKIAHGEIAGQLLYGGCELYGLTINVPGGTGQFSIRRYFTNVLGGAIAVAEVGLYSPGYNATDTCYVFCIHREVVAPAVTVNNGEILRVTITPQIAV